MQMNLLMPSSMAPGTLSRWLKAVGDKIGVGDVVAEIETDKASMQVESPYEGVLVEIRVAEGSVEIEADTVLAVLAE